jgi:beta-galactosidase
LAAPAAVAAESLATVEPNARTAAPGQPIDQPPRTESLRERLLLDFGWRFHLGDACDMAQDFNFRGDFGKTGDFGRPVSTLVFDDNDWKTVDLPHDWAIELPFQNDPELWGKGFYPLGRRYPSTSVGWYRRIFELPGSDAGKRITLEFDGVYRDAIVILNGFYIGRNIPGYVPFSFDVTDFASLGARNVLVVRVDATQSEGATVADDTVGAGIYRHVWLVKTNQVHVKKWGTFVRARVHPAKATVLIRTEVENHAKGAQSTRVTSTILDPAGKAAGKAATLPASIAEGKEHAYEQQVDVRAPALWSLEERNLYKLVTEVEAGGVVTDRYETTFGIRTCAFDAEKGFFLNGKSLKLKGTCNHQDHAGVGSALPDAVQYYRIRKLQEMGCNALRTTHNPPTPELLNAADELGMLVFDETRMMSSNPEGLRQFEILVRRDRNHPSVFMWSMGNEEGVAGTEHGLLILTAMKAVAYRHDGSRPVSTAPPGGENMGKFGFAVCDVQGYNYADPEAEAFHNANPKVPVMGTEQISAVATRGIYVMDPQHGYVGSYDPYTTTGRASCEGWWRFCNARPWLAGGFIWTGFDYRGEPSPNGWPNISSQYGVIDTCGFPKDSFFYFQSWWTPKPVLHLFPHWNWPGLEGQEIAVWVYSNLDRVELFLNGKSLGAKDMKKDSHLAWNVKYAPGTIQAWGYKGGQHVMTAKRETTGPAAKLAMMADREEISANGEDVAMVAVEVQDAQGRVVPVADNEVAFRISGPGKLIGVGNGDPTSHESDIGNSRKAFSGLCMAIVQSAKTAGSIIVVGSSPGLTSASATIATRSVTLQPQVAIWEREVPAGPGITGLWRPVPATSATGRGGRRGGGQVFTFRQNGTMLTGVVEGGPGVMGEAPVAIEGGKVDGADVTFSVGTVIYKGTLKGDQIELQHSGAAGPEEELQASAPPSGPRPVIGPPPDGSDPSEEAFYYGLAHGGRQSAATPAPLILVRAKR